MKLIAKVGFNSPRQAVKRGFLDYNHNVTANEDFAISDFEKQSYALRILNEEFKAAVSRVTDRLKEEGFIENSFRKIIPGCDEYGNIIDMMENTVC